MQTIEIDPIEALNGMDIAAADRIVADAKEASEAWLASFNTPAPEGYYRQTRVWHNVIRAGIIDPCLPLSHRVGIRRALKVMHGYRSPEN